MLPANKDRGRAERRRLKLFHKDLDVLGKECCCLSEIPAVLERSKAQGSSSDGLQCSCLALPDKMVSELNHLVLCLRPHVLLPQVYLKNPHLLSSYYVRQQAYTSVVLYTSRFIFRFLNSRLSSLLRVLRLACDFTPCESSMLQSGHYPQGQIRDGTWHTEGTKLCTKKSPCCKEAPETKWLNYVPVG